MDEMAGPTAQPLDERGRRVQSEADQVDDDVGFQVGDPSGEGAVAVLGDAISGHVANVVPGWIVDVAGGLTAADVDHLVAGAHQPRDQERADVPTSTDDDDTHACTLGRAGKPGSSPGPAGRS